MLGKSATAQAIVNKDNTAAAMGSGTLEVFATPALVALMERAACECIAAELPEGHTSVGTRIDISHTRATPVGETVTATATVTAVEGRRIAFTVSASDAEGVVGEAAHERFIVETERFLRKFKK